MKAPICKICGGVGIDHGEHVGIVFDCDDKKCGEIKSLEYIRYCEMGAVE